jgi:glycosyltransferase involved in cell wall biosynthesis
VKILFDATGAQHGVGGLATYVEALLAGWRNRDFPDEFVILSSSGAEARLRAAAPPNSRIESIRPPRFLRPLAQQLALRKLIRRFDPDVVLASTPVVPMFSSDVPVVPVVHDMRYVTYPSQFSLAQRLYRRAVYTHGYRSATKILAISEATRANLLRACSGTAGKIAVIHHGADHVSDWCRRDKANQAIVLAHWRNKRPDLAIRAWARLKDALQGFDWSLHIVGAAPGVREGLVEISCAAGVEGLVHVHAFLEQSEFEALFTSSKLLLFPSSDEGFGLPILEAMRLDVAVVASDIPASREVGADCALYATPESVEDLAEQCRSLIEHPALLRSMTLRGRERAAAFTWQRTAEQTRGILQAAMKNTDFEMAEAATAGPVRGSTMRPLEQPQTPVASLKSQIKRLLPRFALTSLRRARSWVETKRDRSPEEVFTAIYKHNVWGGRKGVFYSGRGSRDPQVVRSYVEHVTSWLRSIGAETLSLVDLGCGDFAIGRQLVPYCKSYVGVDVVRDLIDHNQAQFGSDRVRFEHLDITADPLPPADVCIVRQVLQHLTNAQIASVLSKLDRYEWVLVSEHHPFDDALERPNVDKPVNSGTRIDFGSGVFVDKPPFAVDPARVQLLFEAPLPDGILRTYVLRLKAALSQTVGVAPTEWPLSTRSAEARH